MGASARGDWFGRSRPSSSPRRRSLAERAASLLEWSPGPSCALSGMSRHPHVTPPRAHLIREPPRKAARTILTEDTRVNILCDCSKTLIRKNNQRAFPAGRAAPSGRPAAVSWCTFRITGAAPATGPPQMRSLVSAKHNRARGWHDGPDDGVHRRRGVYRPGRASARPGTHAISLRSTPPIRASRTTRSTTDICASTCAPARSRPAVRNASGWTCTLAAEERTALENEIARLQRDNALLKNALLERGLPLPSLAGQRRSAPPTSEAAPPRPPAPIPAPQADAGEHRQAEVDRVIATVERWWRRVVELVATIQRDLQGKD